MVVVVGKWSLFIGGRQVMFDCTFFLFDSFIFELCEKTDFVLFRSSNGISTISIRKCNPYEQNFLMLFKLVFLVAICTANQ